MRRAAHRRHASLPSLRQDQPHGQPLLHPLWEPIAIKFVVRSQSSVALKATEDGQRTKRIIMTSKVPDPTPSRPSGWQAMLARLRGKADESPPEEEPAEETAPMAVAVDPAEVLPATSVESPAAPEVPQAIPMEEEVPPAAAVVEEPPAL